ncbi:sodium/potassium/calcium exchanger 1 isoform X4 [Ctenopharyngodon idella]|uniref:sodium/potassium/calcium exchanger 1 isoform X4 n=1 Tax=Ctenopharyngodon idella TaxID=7959 RepID=UPI002230FC73|nr:sodium/potassium/calcium exchanger 1 isoform X4 [Ctenopharyngodon idella]
MMSYLWIFVLGSLIVTGVKMQEDGVEGAENAESPADDLPSTVPDEDNTATEDLPPDSKDESLSDAEPADAEPTPEKPVEEVVDEAAASADSEAEQTDPESGAAEDEQPATPAAAEEPVKEEAPAEAVFVHCCPVLDEGDADKTEADPPAVETELTEQEVKPEEAAGEVEEEPAQEELDKGEADAGETDAGETDAGETDAGETDAGETDTGEADTIEVDAGETDTGETDTGETDTGETDAGETDVGETDVGETDAAEAEPSVVPEKPMDFDVAVKVHADEFDLSDALREDKEEIEMGDADKHSSGQGKARSAGAASEPKDSGSGTVVGVVCGIAVAAVGAITGYFTYQKKKLCFKVQRGDPESAKEENGTQSEPQVLSTLLNSP